MTISFWFRWILVVLYGGSMGIVFVYNLNKMHSWSFFISSNPVIVSCCALVSLVFTPGRDQSSLCWSLLYKEYLVTNFSHTCTRSSLDVNHFVEWPLFYQWTESLLLINSKSRIYLFIYIYLFQYHQAILYIGSLDIILAIFLSLQLIPKQHYLCFVLLLIK